MIIGGVAIIFFKQPLFFTEHLTPQGMGLLNFPGKGCPFDGVVGIVGIGHGVLLTAGDR